MARLRTNLDVRGYAALHDVRLGEIAEHMGITHSTFSIKYMSEELSKEQKNMLKRMIDQIERERNDYRRIQEA